MYQEKKDELKKLKQMHKDMSEVYSWMIYKYSNEGFHGLMNVNEFLDKMKVVIATIVLGEVED